MVDKKYIVRVARLLKPEIESIYAKYGIRVAYLTEELWNFPFRHDNSRDRKIAKEKMALLVAPRTIKAAQDILRSERVVNSHTYQSNFEYSTHARLIMFSDSSVAAAGKLVSMDTIPCPVSICILDNRIYFGFKKDVFLQSTLHTFFESSSIFRPKSRENAGNIVISLYSGRKSLTVLGRQFYNFNLIADAYKEDLRGRIEAKIDVSTDTLVLFGGAYIDLQTNEFVSPAGYVYSMENRIPIGDNFESMEKIVKFIRTGSNRILMPLYSSAYSYPVISLKS